MDIIKSEYVSFEEYKQLVDKYVALDNRESISRTELFCS